MEENKTLKLRSDLAEVAKVEWFIGEFCKQHRLYDEYFGSMLRATDIILKKISRNNMERAGEINISLMFDEREARLEFATSTHMVAAFSLGKSKEDETLRALVNDLKVLDSDKISIAFNINSLHQDEWVRRKQLLNNYHHRVRKEV